MSESSIIIQKYPELYYKTELYDIIINKTLNDLTIQIEKMKSILSKNEKYDENKISSLIFKYLNNPSNGDVPITPLILSIQNDKLDIVKFLLENKLDVNIGNDMYGNTALHIAILKKKLDVIDLLMKHNADKNSLNREFISKYVDEKIRNKLDIPSKRVGETVYSIPPRNTSLFVHDNHIFNYYFEPEDYFKNILEILNSRNNNNLITNSIYFLIHHDENEIEFIFNKNFNPILEDFIINKTVNGNILEEILKYNDGIIFRLELTFINNEEFNVNNDLHNHYPGNPFSYTSLTFIEAFGTTELYIKDPNDTNGGVIVRFEIPKDPENPRISTLSFNDNDKLTSHVEFLYEKTDMENETNIPYEFDKNRTFNKPTFNSTKKEKRSFIRIFIHLVQNIDGEEFINIYNNGTIKNYTFDEVKELLKKKYTFERIDCPPIGLKKEEEEQTFEQRVPFTNQISIHTIESKPFPKPTLKSCLSKIGSLTKKGGKKKNKKKNKKTKRKKVSSKKFRRKKNTKGKII
jgi:hypothetical protein